MHLNRPFTKELRRADLWLACVLLHCDIIHMHILRYLCPADVCKQFETRCMWQSYHHLMSNTCKLCKRLCHQLLQAVVSPTVASGLFLVHVSVKCSVCWCIHVLSLRQHHVV